MDLPAAVTAVVARATGSRPASWQRVVAGYTHADKWRIDLGSSTAFVKASANAVARGQIEQREPAPSWRRWLIDESAESPTQEQFTNLTVAEELADHPILKAISIDVQ